MPQELRVVCCFQCRKFQSDIVKKARKWTCKMCGAKQSLVKEYTRGSGRECRLLVQQLSESSQQVDRFEKEVAEQVLEGKIEQATIGNAIRDESERLVASHSHNHGASGKMEGGDGSKWESFCSKGDDDDDEVDDLLQERAHSSSWGSRVKTGNVGHDRVANTKSKNFVKFVPRKVSEQSAESLTTRLVPLADFHQMDKQDKRQFKWQSKVESESNLRPFSSSGTKSSSSAMGVNAPLFSFKPKSSVFSQKDPTLNLEAKESIGIATQKRVTSDKESNDRSAQMMNFTKKSKWGDFQTENSLISASADVNECRKIQANLPQNSSSISSTSKWSKFVPPDDKQEDEEFA